MKPHLLEDLPANGFVRMPTVMAAVGLARSTIYELIQKQKFPPPEKLTAHAAGWRVAQLTSWLENPTAWRVGDTGSAK